MSTHTVINEMQLEVSENKRFDFQEKSKVFALSRLFGCLIFRGEKELLTMLLSNDLLQL